MSKSFNPILVVAGDPKSIFLEIFFKSIKFSKRPLILIVDKKILKQQMRILGFEFKLNEILEQNIYKIKHNIRTINFIDVPLMNTNDTREYIEECFNISLKILKQNKNLPIINGPINKEKFLKNRYLGITEYLGSKTNKLKDVVMLIYNKKLSVSPLTTHLPLKDVHKNISKSKIINHVKKIDFFLDKHHKKKPNIAITGLNPHCESNYKKSEEKNIIIPTINYLKSKKFNISGPFPADTIFLKNNYKKFDVIIGMYHDQVLTPIKSIFGFNAINITLGLPFIRISPDHGPNVKMFGKNISNPDSLREAIKFLNLQ
ncbi:Pyridoxal phosphate biosynthetic protein PdxA [alpha proteobacterium HIMB5]|nr:Pyridoxal phosphate biosynthetic protein PdxA [alpha proteobacterium HIMB5]